MRAAGEGGREARKAPEEEEAAGGEAPAPAPAPARLRGPPRPSRGQARPPPFGCFISPECFHVFIEFFTNRAVYILFYFS